MSVAWHSWTASHAGSVRTHNEDTFVDRGDISLWAVADGAGGHEHGEVASGALKAALDAMPGLSGAALVTSVRGAVAEVHAALCSRAEAEQAETGRPTMIASTLVVLLADAEYFACLWCGDSRAYLLRDGQLTQLTRDHSLVQEMVDAGVLAASEAESHPHANVLTRVIGSVESPPELDKVKGRAEPGDRLLLCSDGLFKALDAAAIASLAAGDDPAQQLIEAALAATASDNITAIVLAQGPVEAARDALDWTMSLGARDA